MKEYEFEQYRNMLLMCISRTFALDVNEGSNICMVPYADMLNHDTRAFLDYRYNNDDETFELKAVKNIK